MLSKSVMKHTFTLIVCLFTAFTLSSVARAQNKLPWEVDFEKEGLRTFFAECDAGTVIFSEYKGLRMVDGKESLYTGLTISVSGKTRYYVFSPNPDSMSPITFSYMKNDDGSLMKIEMSERNRRLSSEAPNLFHASNRYTNDCTFNFIADEENEEEGEEE